MSGLHIHPRFTLAVLTAGFGLTALRTLDYPPDYLLWSTGWAAVAFTAAAASALVAFLPRRSVVALAGSLVTFCGIGRSIAIVNEILTGDLNGPTLASFSIAAASWVMISTLSFVAFQESVLPWSITVGNRKESHARRNT